MIKGYLMMTTWRTRASWHGVLGAFASVEVLTKFLKQILHPQRHPKCVDKCCYLNMICEDPRLYNFDKAPICENVDLTDKWFELVTVRGYPDSCYQSEESEDVVRLVIAVEVLKKFLFAVAVSCLYVLPSAVSLPSHYFLYQLLKFLKESDNQINTIYCNNTYTILTVYSKV